MKIHREYRKIVAPLLKEGWTLGRGGSGHPRLFPPSREIAPITFPLTPSDWRSVKNFEAAIKRAIRALEGGRK